jgi:diguanylate cyclase (GGDEF)-like protein/PAS domain S-box-containing protein
MRISERQSRAHVSSQRWGECWQPILSLILAALLILGLHQAGWEQAFEQRAYRSLFDWRGALPWDQSVAIVEVDEASLRELQSSPWSRQLYQTLVEKLAEADPAVIALDVLFAGLDPNDAGLAVAIAQQRVVLAQAWSPDHQPILTSSTLIQAASALGHVVQSPDADGLVRAVPAHLSGLGALGLAATQLYRDYTTAPPVPDPQPQIWLNWEDSIQQIAHYSAAAVIQGDLPPQQFRNKIVLVGSTLDRLSTPFDRASPAIYLQATLVSNLLQQDMLTKISRPKTAVVVLLLTLVALGCATRWHWGYQVGLWLALSGGWLGLGGLAFHANLWLPLAMPILGFLLTGSLLLLIRFVTAFFELRQNETRHALMMQGFNEGVWDWDLKTNRFYFSLRWKQMIGYSEAALSDHPQEWFDRVHPLDRPALDAAIAEYLQGIGNHFEHEYRLRHEDGSYRWMQGRGLAVSGKAGKATRLVGSQVDITAQKQAEEELWRSTFFDRLTELPSWAGFVNHLQQSINQAQQDAQSRFAILWLDLDQFKLVNHSLGNGLGDRLLVAIAQRLKAFLSANEIVARLGEDEFAILLRHIQDNDEAIRMAEQIQQVLARPFNIEEHEVFVTVSIGIALSAPYYAQPEHLLRDAGTAMYRAKAMGRASYQVFDKGMRTGMLVKLRLESDLRRAIAQGIAQGERQTERVPAAISAGLPTSLDAGALPTESAELPAGLPANPPSLPACSPTGLPDTELLPAGLTVPPAASPEHYPELELYYQPIVRLSTGQVTGFEALVRWQHAEEGLLFPSRFISMAEETGLIIPLSWWILRTACRQMSQWRQQFPENAALTMSVNLSSKQFSMSSLAEQIEQILQESHLEPTCLKLEMTESMVMENAPNVIDMLYQLRALGIRLAIDDFGTGYSSLSYLPRFPLTTLKIDRSFVDQIGDCNDNLEIVRTILALAHNLRMDVVAEGVETEAQATRLREMGCEYGQGFFFHKPLNVEAATQLLAK